MSEKESSPFWRDPQVLRLAALALGLIGSFVIYGIVQEQITRVGYTVDDNSPAERFTDAAFLVLNNRIFAVVVALFMLWRQGEQISPVAPLYTYAGVSVSNWLATLCQYSSLRYVDFPTQTLGKCGKMIPVMIIGAVMSGKRYGPRDYGLAIVITGGCMLFLLSADEKEQKAGDNTFLGILLILGYLFSDGFTSTLQERMFKGYTMPKYNQMLYVNTVSAIFSILAVLGQGTLLTDIDFMIRYPLFVRDSIILSLSAVAGQVIIYTTIKEFGALAFATIMTTRQFLNILFSCLIFLHPLSLGQWIATGIVFGGLYYEGATKQRSGHGHGHGHHAPAKPAPTSDVAGDTKV